MEDISRNIELLETLDGAKEYLKTNKSKIVPACSRITPEEMQAIIDQYKDEIVTDRNSILGYDLINYADKIKNKTNDQDFEIEEFRRVA